MNYTIDVNATFHQDGRIKPIYIRLEDEENLSYTYKIEKINNWKDEGYSGIHSILYDCQIKSGDFLKEIKIRYYVESHKWALIKPNKS